jgi:hypothetical protein
MCYSDIDICKKLPILGCKMEKTVKCPACKKGILDIELEKGLEVDFNKPFKEHTHRCVCENCLRTIKYSVKPTRKDG